MGLHSDEKDYFFAISTFSLCVLSVTGTLAGNSNDGKSREIIVYNQGNIQIIAFHGAPAKSNSWDPDLMPGIGKIRPGKARKFDLDDGKGACVYNLKALFAEGSTQDMRSANICEAIAAGSGWVVSNQ